jgi:hypothetical protein
MLMYSSLIWFGLEKKRRAEPLAGPASSKHMARDVQALQVTDPAVRKQLQPSDPHRRSKPPKSENVGLARRPEAKKSSKKTQKSKAKASASDSAKLREAPVRVEVVPEPPLKKSAPEPGGAGAKPPGHFRFISPNGVLEGEIPPGAHFHVHLGDS